MKSVIFHAYETVTSTQDIAREKALAGEPAGTVISATFQTNGRGRQGRGWFAPPGANVCMTVIGEKVWASEAWQVALVAGIAVAEGIHEALPEVSPTLRFPNDIYLSGRKLGGVLVETVPHAKAGYVIPLVGIGVNVNIPEEMFPEELRTRATSLQRETGKPHSKGIVSGLIRHRLGSLWGDFTRGPLGDAILPRWRALRDPDTARTFHLDGEVVRCRVLDIAGSGEVTLLTDAGKTYRLHAAQVILGDD